MRPIVVVALLLAGCSTYQAIDNKDAGDNDNNNIGNGDSPVSAPAKPNVSNSFDAGKDTDGEDSGIDSSTPAVHCGDKGQALCQLGETCRNHADCSSDACDYKYKCVDNKSCTAHYGSDTCGAGEDNDPKAQHVSCCETAPLFNELSNVKLDRFLITAGRMRTFIERMNGDVRSFTHTLPSNVWSPEYDEFVPSNMAEADVQLGSFFNKKSCQPGDYTGRTWWTPPTADDYSDYSKDQLDEKALNCVSWEMLLAFCHWTGGRLPTGAEISNAFTNGNRYTQPWLWQPGAVQYYQPVNYSEDTPSTTTFNHSFSYNYPPSNVRSDPNLDIAYHISPPGRFPQSWNMNGHEIAGNLLEYNSDARYEFSSTYSWEHHGSDGTPDSNWKDFEATAGEHGLFVGYYALGGRCAR